MVYGPMRLSVNTLMGFDYGWVLFEIFRYRYQYLHLNAGF